MKPSKTPAADSALRWYGPGQRRWTLSWRKILWFLLYPERKHRTGLTLSGVLLVAVSVAIGTAAYNSANNILFLTLSLLLGCLILSGVLSWLNFRGLRWRLETDPPLRVGQEHAVTLVLRNGKSFIPTYSIWFELEIGSTGQTFELPLRGRLDAGDVARLACSFRPTMRGWETLKLNHVGSLFPFGFLRKSFSVSLEERVIVWPAPVEYRRFGTTAWQRAPSGESIRRAGQGGDLLALRRYQLDDSHRQIHWKASARLRQLMVRQTAAESGEGFSIWLDPSPDRWTRADQFELLCSFAATLAEDLFTAGRLRAAAVGRDPLVPVRRLRDLEQFLDRLATLTVSPKTRSGVVDHRLQSNLDVANPSSLRRSRLNFLTFAPDGARGVAAYVNGEKAAAT